MGWRDIRKQTNRKLGRIDRALYEKQRKMSEITTLVGQGVSLFDKWATGKREHKALEEFGTSEGLTYDKKSKTFYGSQLDKTLVEEHFQISPAELKNMQNFMKYTDKTSIYDFISTEKMGIKKGYSSEGMPVYNERKKDERKKDADTPLVRTPTPLVRTPQEQLEFEENNKITAQQNEVRRKIGRLPKNWQENYESIMAGTWEDKENR